MQDVMAHDTGELAPLGSCVSCNTGPVSAEKSPHCKPVP